MDIAGPIVFAIGRICLYWRGFCPRRAPDQASDFNPAPIGPLAKYRPMLRLFSEQDHEFLRRQPGYRADIWRQLVSRRRRIFARYLASLVREFRQLHRLGGQFCSNPLGQNPSVLQLLAHERVQFAGELLRLRAQLVLHGLGFAPPDAGPVLRRLQRLYGLMATASLEPTSVGSGEPPKANHSTVIG